MPRKDPEKYREYMKEYHKKYDAIYYQKNRDRHLKQKKERRKMIRTWFVTEILPGLKCKCGEDHWACLEFHHRNPEEKEYTISYLCHSSLGKKRILKEIEKCDVMCANCHRKYHYPKISLPS